MRESPRVTVVTIRTIRELNINPMSKICSSQTSLVTEKLVYRSALRDTGFLFHVFIVLLLSKWLNFVFPWLLCRILDPHGQQVHWDIDAYANIRRSVILWILWAMCRFVLHQPERILIYSSGKITLHGFLRWRECFYKSEEMVKSNDKTECETFCVNEIKSIKICI